MHQIIMIYKNKTDVPGKTYWNDLSLMQMNVMDNKSTMFQVMAYYRKGNQRWPGAHCHIALPSHTESVYIATLCLLQNRHTTLHSIVICAEFGFRKHINIFWICFIRNHCDGTGRLNRLWRTMTVLPQLLITWLCQNISNHNVRITVLVYPGAMTIKFNTLRPRQHGRHFADDTFKRIFLHENIILRLKFHWSLFLRAQLTIFQHWFR